MQTACSTSSIQFPKLVVNLDRQPLTQALQTAKVTVPLVSSPGVWFRPLLLLIESLRSRRLEPWRCLTPDALLTAEYTVIIYSTCAVRALVLIDRAAGHKGRADRYVVCWDIQQRRHERRVDRLTP
jgi:hypothetical protein